MLGIYFVSTPLFGSSVLMLLEAFLSMLNATSIWCVDQRFGQ